MAVRKATRTTTPKQAVAKKAATASDRKHAVKARCATST